LGQARSRVKDAHSKMLFKPGSEERDALGIGKHQDGHWRGLLFLFAFIAVSICGAIPLLWSLEAFPWLSSLWHDLVASTLRS
jgi:hypothetical protein